MSPGRTALAVTILLGSLPASAARSPKAVYQDQQYRVRPDRKDEVAPSIPKVELGDVTRGRGPQVSDDGTRLVVSKTDGHASVDLVVSAQDDRTPPEELGFEVNVFDVFGVEGGLQAPPFPLAAKDGRVVLRWEERAQDEQKPVTFLVSVRSVDRAGNKSKPTPSFPVVVPGRRMAELESEGRDLGPLAAGACGAAGADAVVQVHPSRFLLPGPIRPDATWILLDAQSGERREEGDPVAAILLPPRLDGSEMLLRIRCASGDELARWVQRRDDGRLGLSTSSDFANPMASGYQPPSPPIEHEPAALAEP